MITEIRKVPVTEETRPFATALKVCPLEELGYAEADPSADIDGDDIRRKLTISANIAFDALLREEDIPAFGMVKDDRHRTRALVHPDGREIGIQAVPAVFSLIGQIQEETHRFAIEYHRQLRGKGQVHSILDDIEGIGPARRKALMRHYLSLDAIKAASIEELAKLPSMNEKAAQAVYNFFHT